MFYIFYLYIIYCYIKAIFLTLFYVLFVDIEGHAEDDSVKKALSELEEHAAMVRLLGSYPRAVL